MSHLLIDRHRVMVLLEQRDDALLFREAVKLSRMVEAVPPSAEVTLVLATDAAIDRSIIRDVFRDFFRHENVGQLRKVMAAHVLRGRWSLETLAREALVTSWDGVAIPVWSNAGTVYLDGVAVQPSTEPDILMADGLIVP